MAVLLLSVNILFSKSFDVVTFQSHPFSFFTLQHPMLRVIFLFHTVSLCHNVYYDQPWQSFVAWNCIYFTITSKVNIGLQGKGTKPIDIAN